ncbi:hypothetical protein NL676_025295 [Syzygium grande]|nr:hypothetical protein NL676_025295 [Syzygium grande]
MTLAGPRLGLLEGRQPSPALGESSACSPRFGGGSDPRPKLGVACPHRQLAQGWQGLPAFGKAQARAATPSQGLWRWPPTKT